MPNDNEIQNQMIEWFSACNSESEVAELKSSIYDLVDLVAECRTFDLSK